MSSAERLARYDRALDFAEGQVYNLIDHHPGFLPAYTTAGLWKHSGELWTDWCGGFLAGLLWQFYERTGDDGWRSQAEWYSRMLEPRRTDGRVHDLGFIFLNSYRRWYELRGGDGRMDIVAEAGTTLAGRFQENGRYLASFMGPHSLFIDIM